MEYQIISTNKKAFWNNLQGWVGMQDGTIFSEEERNFFNLPCDGVWVPYAPSVPVTVGELRKYLEQLPPDMAIAACGFQDKPIGFCACIRGINEESSWSPDSDTDKYVVCLDVR